MPKELVSVVRDAGGEPVRMADPETNSEYIVVPAVVYEQLRELLGTGNALPPDARRRLLLQAGLRAGWDDPEMDAYNDLDPRNSR
jgi:hypothetical protein